ncbi:MAG: diaminopimelate epimerase [Pyrinomonadaceae bacterium]
MQTIEFTKFHGFGNDYLVIRAEDLKAISNLGAFAQSICNRHKGVGADGIAVLEKSTDTESDFYCRIINPDGSEAGFSGNGTRCAVAYVYYSDTWSDSVLRLRTNSGVKRYEFLGCENNSFEFLSELGIPNSLQEMKKTLAGFEFEFPPISLDVGNPVCAIFVSDFAAIEWRRIGAALESNTELFPQKTNVVFVKTIDRGNIEIRIWERGAAETSSSGTCSIAAAVAAVYTNRTEREVAVHAVGGTTSALWREDEKMLITGTAELAFSGEFPYATKHG